MDHLVKFVGVQTAMATPVHMQNMTKTIKIIATNVILTYAVFF